jgi:hypothetical protein
MLADRLVAALVARQHLTDYLGGGLEELPGNRHAGDAGRAGSGLRLDRAATQRHWDGAAFRGYPSLLLFATTGGICVHE